MTFPGLEFWVSLIDKAATVALAAFAIWMLQREYRRQLDERSDRLDESRRDHQQEREQLVCVIERNTEAWQRATQTMADIATGVAMLVTTIDHNREAISGIRVLLARRPCIAEAAADKNWGRGSGDDPDGGHPRPASGSSSGS
jgi:hypothetical protein